MSVTLAVVCGVQLLWMLCDPPVRALSNVAASEDTSISRGEALTNDGSQGRAG